MPSIVELVYSAVGADTLAAATLKVSEALAALQRAAGTASTAAASTSAALTATAQAAPVATKAIDAEAAAAARSAQVNAAVAAALRELAAAAPATTAAVGALNTALQRENATAATAAPTLQELSRQLGAAKLYGTDAEISAARLALQHARTASATTQHTATVRSFSDQVRDVSASLRDRLVPQLDAGTRQMLGLAAAAFSVRAAYLGLKDAIGDAAHLRQLQLRTGETIRDLVVEEQAFKNAGLGAERLAYAANRVSQALSPAAVAAKRNAAVLQEMGLSMADLRTQSFYEQIQSLSAGLARLPDQAQRAQAAMQLFGREAGGEMLQLLGNPQALAVANAQAGKLGDTMAANAAALAKTEIALNGINARFKEIWITAATQVTPQIEGLLNLLGSGGGGGLLGNLLGAAGPTAGAGLMALWGVDKLDMHLSEVAGRFKGTLRGATAEVVGGATGALATALPFGLAAALAAQITLGLLDAWNNAEIQAIFDEARHAHDEAGAATRKMRTATSGSQFDAGREETLIALEDARSELARLTAKRDAPQTRDQKLAALKGEGTPEILSEGDTKRIGELEIIVRKLSLAAREALDPLKKDATIVANELADREAKAAKLVLQMDQLEKQNLALKTRDMEPAARARALNAEAAGLQHQLNTIPAGLSEAAAKATRLDLENKLYAVQIQQHQTALQIAAALKTATAEKEKQEIFALQTQAMEAKAAGDLTLEAKLKRQIESKQAIAGLDGKDLELAQARLPIEQKLADIEAKRAEMRRTMEQEKTALEDRLNGIRDQLARMEADYSRTAQEKWGEKKREIEQEIVALRAAQKLEQDRAAAATTPEDKALHERAAVSYGREVSGAQNQLAGLGADPSSLLDQITAKLTAVRESMGTWQQSIASGFSEAFANASSGLQKLIGDTQYWSSKLGNIAGPIMGGITKAITDMFTQWIVQRGLAAARSIAASEAEGSADWIAKLPGALLSSITSYGVAPVIGLAALLAATAAVGGGFATGGYFQERPAGYVSGPGTGTSDSILARVSNKEWIAPEWMTQDAEYGPQIAALEAARRGTPGFAGGGLFGIKWWNKLKLTGIDQNIVNWYKGLKGQSAGPLQVSYTAPVSASAGSATAASASASPATAPASADAAAGGDGSVSRESARNINIYFDRAAFLEDSRNDIRAIALEVFKEQGRA